MKFKFIGNEWDWNASSKSFCWLEVSCDIYKIIVLTNIFM